MSEVAEIAGVSTKTVSNVLRGGGGASETTREKVLAAVRATGYRLNPGAAALRSGRHGAIALAIPTLQQPIYADLATALMREADGLQVVLELTRGEPERERELLAGSWSARCDGLILVPRGLDPASQEVAEILSQGRSDGARSTVLVTHTGRAGLSRVTCPPASQSLLVASHLRDLGRQRVAVIGVAETADRWTETSLEVLRDAGLEVPDGAVVRLPEYDSLESGVVATARLLHSGTRFDAIVCHNDAVASGAATALMRRGARVPDDVAVVGRGDTETAAFAAPPLTSVSCASQGLAASALRLLAPALGLRARVEDGPRAIEVAPVLTVRTSTQRADDTSR